MTQHDKNKLSRYLQLASWVTVVGMSVVLIFRMIWECISD